MALNWLLLAVLYIPCANGGSGIKGPPQVEPHSSYFAAREGSNIKIICPINASPEPFYEWRKDDEMISSLTWPRYVDKRRVLKIKEVQFSDKGLITCSGVNGFGKAKFTYTLNVYDKDLPPEDKLQPPEIIQALPESGTLEIMTGHRGSLTCRAEGIPLPIVTWYKGDQKLPRTGPKYPIQTASIGHAGVYTCKAHSPIGSITHNFTVNVLNTEAQPDMKITGTTNSTVYEGGNTTLLCNVRASQTPSIQWLKEASAGEIESSTPSIRNSTLQFKGRVFFRISIGDDIAPKGDGSYLSKLSIRGATSRHQGTYVCLGVNSDGYSYREAYLQVLSDQHGMAGGHKEINGTAARNINWLYVIIPLTVVAVIAVAVLVVCQSRRGHPDKTMTPPSTASMLKSDDPSALTPLNQADVHPLQSPPSLPPDIVYNKDRSGYPSSTANRSIASGPHYLYPESFGDPTYSDPYSEHRALASSRGPTSDQNSCTRLTHASSSPLPPPPYNYPNQLSNNHSVHRQPQYIVHYNL